MLANTSYLPYSNGNSGNIVSKEHLSRYGNIKSARKRMKLVCSFSPIVDACCRLDTVKMLFIRHSYSRILIAEISVETLNPGSLHDTKFPEMDRATLSNFV
jgi:hypothetical protein